MTVSTHAAAKRDLLKHFSLVFFPSKMLEQHHAVKQALISFNDLVCFNTILSDLGQVTPGNLNNTIRPRFP
jgi:hypothetical protein